MRHDEIIVRKIMESRKPEDTWEDLAGRYSEEIGTYVKAEAFRSVARGLKLTLKKPIEYTHSSERYIEIPTDGKWSEEDVIRAHGLDPKKWQISTLGSTRSKIGSNNDDGYLINTYQKASFKPIDFRLTAENIKDIFSKIKTPVYPKGDVTNPYGMIEFGFADMHFWVNDGDTYKRHLSEALTWLETQEWERIVIPIGGDLFHANNSSGTTVKGTQVTHDMDIVKVLQWAEDFYIPLLQTAQNRAKEVTCLYIPGNHDKDLSLAFAYHLKKTFPDIDFDLSIEPFKRVTYGSVFIGLPHGDKGSKDLSAIYWSKYRQEMAFSELVEIHQQHLHHEGVKTTKMGIVERVLPTAGKTDAWSEENGHIGGEKVFQAFIYTKTRRKAIIYLG